MATNQLLTLKSVWLPQGRDLCPHQADGVNKLSNPFSLQHLPYGIVNFGESTPHVCVRYDNLAISLSRLCSEKILVIDELDESVFKSTNLNGLVGLPANKTVELRSRLQELISQGRHEHKDVSLSLKPYPEEDPRVLCPLLPRDFVDFYCSRHHAFRVGCLFRGPENALPEQYFNLPIGYHGRSSTIFGSGTPVPRPQGISKGTPPRFGPSERLDYELEVGFVLRPHQGRLTPDQAWQKIFGVVLVNDWSARDIQAFEYKPLGPFLGKSFATTVGNWITPLEALEGHFMTNQDSDHEVLPHLFESAPHHIDLPITANLSKENGEILTVCRSNLKNLAWSPAQMVAHLSSNDTIISAGDLIATGTVSGPDNGSEACLLELTSGGKKPFSLAGNEQTFLKDGDSITLFGGHHGVGLAPCSGKVMPSPNGKQHD